MKDESNINNKVNMNKFPDVVRIEPTGKCNFRCRHCLTGIKPNKRPILDIRNFFRIIDQFKANNFIPRVVVLYHGGEPLLNKHIAYYIYVLKMMGVFKVQIVTNGNLLTENLSLALIKAGLDEIHISFDGNNASENNYIRRGGNFDKDAENVVVFYAIYNLYRKYGFKKIRILISNTQVNNEPDFNYIKEYFRTRCSDIEFQSVPVIDWPGMVYIENNKHKNNSNYCKFLFETITIMSDGNVVPCCYDIGGDMILGNVFKESIFNIWENSKYTTMRNLFRYGLYSGKLCSNCNITK